MPSAIAKLIAVATGLTVYGGRPPTGGRLKGTATLDSVSASGTIAPQPSDLSGDAALGSVTASGTVGTPAIVISGSNWTPNRDGSGNVLQSDWVQMPTNTWYYVNDSQSNLDQASETPHLTKANSADSFPSVVAAWGGMAWDYTNGVAYISGGGHSDGHPCETGVYRLGVDKLRWTRIINRQDVSQAQYWNGSALVAGVAYPPENYPLINGVPGSFHTYDGLEYIPPAGLSNTNGGLYYPGSAKTVIDLDTNTYKTTHWNAPPVSDDWSYAMAFYDSGSIIRPRNSFMWARHTLSGSSSSSWSASSFGTYNISYATSGTSFQYATKIFVKMPQRREVVSIAGNQAAVRVRVGQAMDAAATTWTSYHDTIALTSSDNSHLDFNTTNLADNTNAILCGAGASYDHAAGCIWICANTVGGALYKITGLSGSTWTVEKITGPTALTLAALHTFGRFVVHSIFGVKIGMRITSTTGALEVIRLA